MTEALPWLLGVLAREGLSATFFVEAINCELYPEALGAIVAGGHELGMHGWRHEQWGRLSSDRERSLLERCVRAFGSLGLSANGFRPPGGELTTSSVELLRSVGVRWCSPEGGEFGVRDGLAWEPFEWGLVDAYYLMESFADLRVLRGDAPGVMPAETLAARFRGAVRSVARDRRRATLILHPFLMLDAAWREGVGELLAEIGALARAGDLWVGTGGELAGRLGELPA